MFSQISLGSGGPSTIKTRSSLTLSRLGKLSLGQIESALN